MVAMSALLTTAMLSMKDTIEVLREEGLRDSVKVIVGGAGDCDFATRSEPTDGRPMRHRRTWPGTGWLESSFPAKFICINNFMFGLVGRSAI